MNMLQSVEQSLPTFSLIELRDWCTQDSIRAGFEILLTVSQEVQIQVATHAGCWERLYRYFIVPRAPASPGTQVSVPLFFLPLSNIPDQQKKP